MAEVIIPGVNKGKDDKETIQNLFDAYIRLRRELDFMLQNLDGMNIDKAYINSLEVGSDIQMGPNARLTFGQIDEVPDFTTNNDVHTILGYDYVLTGKVYANQISGGVANLSDSVNIGDPNSFDPKSINFYTQGSEYTKITGYPGGGLSIDAMNNITIDSPDSISLHGGTGTLGIGIHSGTASTDSQFVGNIHFWGGITHFEDSIHFDDNCLITGLSTEPFTQGNHNHGIPPGTKLAVVDYSNNITGYITFAESGGFSHYHDIY